MFHVFYNGFVCTFPSITAARRFAREIRGGGCCPVVKPARSLWGCPWKSVGRVPPYANPDQPLRRPDGQSLLLEGAHPGTTRLVGGDQDGFW